MRTIQLTQGRVALVDDDDYERLSQYNWQYAARYAVRTVRRSGRADAIYMHREIMQPPEEMEVDHINGDRLDNRKSNLRLATRSQNKWNTGKRKDSTSGFKGVGYHKRAKKWQVRIKHHGKRYSLGYFSNIIDAALAYDKAALELHGEFAKLNFDGYVRSQEN